MRYFFSILNAALVLFFSCWITFLGLRRVRTNCQTIAPDYPVSRQVFVRFPRFV